MTQTGLRKISTEDVTPNRTRGGDLRAMLTPATVGTTQGFMGMATLARGEVLGEHYHPYSEEYLYVSRGRLLLTVDGEPIEVAAGEAVFIPKNARHRLVNNHPEPVELVFALAPLAPRPELGHVETEPRPETA